MRLAIIILVGLSLASCDLQRKVQKSETETGFSETIRTQETRKGDTVRYKIPLVTFRDTTIYTVSRLGTQLATRYDTNGRVSNIDCISPEIMLVREEIRALQQNQTNKNKEESSEFDSTIVLYIALAVVLICMFALFLIFLYLRKSTQAITSFMNGFSK